MAQYKLDLRGQAWWIRAENLLRCLGLLPLPLLYLLTCPLALLFFAPRPWFWRRIFGNLRYIEPGCSRRRGIAMGLRRALYFGEQLAEWMYIPWRDPSRLSARRAPLRALPPGLETQPVHSGPIFLLTAHQGNFVLSSIAVRFHCTPWLSVPAMAIFQRQHGLQLSRLLGRYDQQYKVETMDSGIASMRRLAELRRTGAPSLIFALGDNAAQPGSAAHRVLRVPMLGGERLFRRGLVEVAVRMGAPIFFIHCRRIGLGRYETFMEQIAEPPYQDGDSERMLRRYASCTEKVHREAPQFSHILLNNPKRWLDSE